MRCAPEQRRHYTDLATTYLGNDVCLYEIRRIPDSLAFERVFIGVCISKIWATNRSDGDALKFTDDTSVAESHPAIQRQIESGQFSQALPAIDQALDQNPDSVKLWRTKGVALGYLEGHAEALACFERATELSPRFLSAWYHRGVACSILERYEDAVLAYEEAHRLNSSDASTSFNLGCFLAHLGRLKEAKSSLIAAEEAGHPRARDILSDIQRAIAEEEA